MLSSKDEILALDHAHVWHPYSPMEREVKEDLVAIARANGVWLHDYEGNRYLDANSSWWVMNLGHGHPRIAQAIREQLETLGHCALAGITHAPAAEFAAALCKAAPSGLSRVFFTDNGSTAVEAALRMCLQRAAQVGEPKRARLLSLASAFHGDTLGAASLGGISLFRKPFGAMTLDCIHLPSPAETFDKSFEQLTQILQRTHEEIAAVIVEPLIQGAAGMRIYSAEFLRHARALCTRFGVPLVVDEVFTGFGRTGAMWACDHAGIEPDILCLGKTLAAPIPMGAVLVREEIVSAFYGGRDRALLYGHTFCGNPLGARVGLEVLRIFEDEQVVLTAATRAKRIASRFESFRGLPGVLRTRSLGMVGALDLEDTEAGYLGTAGWRVFREAKARGIFLRPLGSTVYIAPPLTISEGELSLLLDGVEESLCAVSRSC